MKIAKVICSKGRTGFFFDDQKAIKAGAKADGQAYIGKPLTDGFSSIRQSGEAISVMLVLSDGQIAYGDCAAVQYSGTGGRDPLFLAQAYIPVIDKHIAPLLVNREITSFKELASIVDNMTDPLTNKRLHTAIRYGITQALLDAVAKANHITMAEVVSREYATGGVSKKEIRIFSQSGDSRYDNVDKMIIKGSATLPHALINNVDTKLGRNGEILLEYIKWLSNRITQLRSSKDYNPVIHIDVYGTIGIIFNNDVKKIVDYYALCEQAAKPYQLYLEGAADVGDRTKQMEILRDICIECKKRKISVKTVADEWCNTYEDVVYFADNKAGDMVQIKTPDLGGINNTIEAVLYCKKVGMEAYQGGTCNETNRSAEVCVNLAMATKPDLMLAKPGMGVDEGYMIVYNEMQRILALTK